MEDRACCAQRRVHSGAAEPIEGLDLEVIAQGMDGLVEKKGITIVGEVVGKSAEGLELFLRDEKFGGGHPGEFVFQLLLIGKFREGKFSG